MRTRAIVAAAVPAALALLTPRQSHALELVEIGVGPMVAFGGNWIGKPGEKTVGGGATTDVYPGVGGTSFGYGLMLDVRVIKFLGLEIDYIKRSSKGKGDIDLTDPAGNVTAYQLEVSHEGTQIPVLLKGVMPVPLFAPYVLLGKEFIQASGASANYLQDGKTVQKVPAYVDNYSYWTFGIGAEVKLPIPGWDIRIPMSVRGSYNPGVSDKLEDRGTFVTSGNRVAITAYDAKFQYQAVGTVGVAGYF